MKPMVIPVYRLVLSFVLLLTIFLNLTLLPAQELTVMTAKGGVFLKRSGGQQQALTTGSAVKMKDFVVLQSPAYLVLSSQGKTIELQQAGTFPAAEIYKRLQSSSTGVSGKLTAYIFSEMQRSPSEVDKHKQNISAPASVDRAKSDKKTDAVGQTTEMAQSGAKVPGEKETEKPKSATDVAVDAATSSIGNIFGVSVPSKVTDIARKAVKNALAASTLTAIMPLSTKITDSLAHFYWTCSQKDASFMFRITDMSGSTVYEYPTNDSALVVEIQPVLLEPGQCYRWSVSLMTSPDIHSEEQCLSRPYPESAGTTRDTLSMIRRELGTSALAAAAQGLIYERHGMLWQALLAYYQAAQRAPAVEEYDRAVRRLLERWGAEYYPVYNRILRSWQ